MATKNTLIDKSRIFIADEYKKSTLFNGIKTEFMSEESKYEVHSRDEVFIRFSPCIYVKLSDIANDTKFRQIEKLIKADSKSKARKNLIYLEKINESGHFIKNVRQAKVLYTNNTELSLEFLLDALQRNSIIDPSTEKSKIYSSNSGDDFDPIYDCCY